MTDQEIKTLVQWNKTDFPPRALMWAYYNMPKYKRNPEGDYEAAMSFDRFPYLKRHKNAYYQFLEDWALEKDVYDTFIGTYEPEERTTW